MSIRRILLTVSAAVATVAVAGVLWAQPKPEGSGGDSKDADASIPMEKKVLLPPKEMRETSEQLIDDMKSKLERVLAIQQVARKQKDVIRLNCVNDRLLQVKKLLNIAESSRNDLIEAIAADDERERYHQFKKVRISHEKVSVLRDEAEACVGEELIFIGPTEVEVDKPAIPDDPTRNDPFVLTGEAVAEDGLERPAYASPYL
jgi:hypothetical protein